MPEQPTHLAQQLLQAKSLGEQFAAESSALSDMLVEFDNTLGAIEGKAEVVLKTPKGAQLSFRRAGKEWGLFYSLPSESMRPLVLATIEDKLDSIGVLPTLVAKLAHIHTENLQRVRDAKAVLTSLMPTLQQAAKGGA